MAVRPMKVWNAATSTWDDVAVSQRGDVILNALISASKGALITSTGSAVDDLTVGTDGHVLTADSNETLGIKWAAPAGGLPTQTSQAGKFLTTNGTTASWVDPPTNRNLVINGAMQVSQRGTSTTGATSGGYFTADRWTCNITSMGTWTQDIQTDAPTGSGFRRSLRMLCTTADASPAAGDLVAVQQFLEGQDLQRIRKGTSDAQQLTASFWVKSNVTGTYVLEITDDDNTRHAAGTYTISASGTWERKTVTLAADTTGAFDNDNARSMQFNFWLAAGSNFTSGTLPTGWASTTTANRAVGQTNLAAATNNYWQITGVQLETGPVATPFEFEPYETTLRKCQRYYYLHVSGTDKAICMGFYDGANQGLGVIHLPTSMRIASPTMTATSGTNYYAMSYGQGSLDYCDSLLSTFASNNTAVIYNNTQMSGTAGNATYWITKNASASIAFSAEL